VALFFCWKQVHTAIVQDFHHAASAVSLRVAVDKKFTNARPLGDTSLGPLEQDFGASFGAAVQLAGIAHVLVSFPRNILTFAERILTVMRYIRLRSLVLLAVLSLVALNFASAQSYHLTKLVSNVKGATHTDTQLVNAWGLAYGPGAPFWVADAATGLSTLYDGSGNKQSLVVTIPTASGSGKGSPTGIVYNSSTEFQIETWTSAFLFATLDGTISGWSHFEPKNALIGVNNSGSHTSYTGLAITSKSSGNRIFAADNANNKVDVYDGSFNFVTSFTDHTIPAGFSVFGIQDIKGKVYVSYAANNGSAGGYIDIFTEKGVFVKRFTSGAPLNQPWGFALAPATGFGPLSNTLLIANNTPASTISGFNLTTGKFVATVKDAKGNPIKIDQLWGIEFGGGSTSNGAKTTLFFAAGPKNFTQGLFGTITFQ
jgi:uncharacterized protein (TIGR03118 family)